MSLSARLEILAETFARDEAAEPPVMVLILDDGQGARQEGLAFIVPCEAAIPEEFLGLKVYRTFDALLTA